MSLYTVLMEALEARDIEKTLDCYHPDYQFVRHQTNTILTLEEWRPMMEGMMASDKWVMETARCIYENDDILVSHSLMSFPDDTKESVIVVHTKKAGKIVRTETGATPIKD